jgi:hypothetical protein
VARGAIPTTTPNRFKQAKLAVENQGCKNGVDHRFGTLMPFGSGGPQSCPPPRREGGVHSISTDPRHSKHRPERPCVRPIRIMKAPLSVKVASGRCKPAQQMGEIDKSGMSCISNGSPRCWDTRSSARRMADRMPSASALSIGTRRESFPRAMTKPPVCCERWKDVEETRAVVLQDSPIVE